MRSLFCIVALALCAAVIPHTAKAASGGNPCALLSLGEAQAITHFSLTSTDPNPMRADGGADKDTTCTYNNEQTGQGVSVMLHDDAAFFPGNSKNPNTEGFKALKGVGDRAWTNGLAMAAAVYVLRHGHYVSIMVTDPNGLKDRGAHNYASALAVAKTVAKRM